MAEKREPPTVPVLADDPEDAHPVEPAEGADEPGEDVSNGRAAHPAEPAEGDR